MERFRDRQERLDDFTDHFLVVCPHCQACATVQPQVEGGARLSCPHCGHSQQWQATEPGILYCQQQELYPPGQLAMGAPVDCFFHLPLWLQTQVKGHTLWAYNPRHLAWLKALVAADHRQRQQHDQHGWSNQALLSRLPKWLKAGNNRGSLLKAMAKLEKKVE